MAGNGYRRYVIRRFAWLLAAIGVLASAPAASAQGDPAETALNIIPSGQYGDVPAPPEADQQARMYDGLTPLFDNVTDADLTRYFKSEALGVGPDGPTTNEPVPRPGVTITRDRFNVPHVKAQTYEDGIWAAGWIAAADRRLLGELARYNARVDAIDVPGLSGFGLLTSLQNFQPSEEAEAEIAKQSDVLERKGKPGRAVLRDIDTFISGINDFIAENDLSDEPWTRNDVFSLNAFKGQFVGQGGGDEARRTQFFSGLASSLGSQRGLSVFNDLRQFKNPGSPTSVDEKFRYGHLPKRRRGNTIIDPGSFTPTPAVDDREAAAAAAPDPTQASNTLMIGAGRSATGNPLMVGGPQIGYSYPGFTWEVDMDAPGLRWRGATSAPFPGYLLIGRGEDFATTLTSSSGDIIDQFAERLCGGSEEMYRYRGECRQMERFDAGTLDGEPVSFLRTVHGPVIGYATVNGNKVAIAEQRSSYGKDTLDQLFYRRLSTGRVHNPRSFYNAADKTPQTFNSFYIDEKHIAEFTSGKMPLRARGVDPGLVTKGNGKYEWRGFLSRNRHIHGTDPRDGTITNWNNISAHGFGAADDNWGGNGSAARVDLLDYNLNRLKRDGEWSLASVTAAMNAAATQDVRAIRTVPLLGKLLRGASAPSSQAQQMLDLLLAWRANGGNRLDLTGDGLIDDPGAAIMDAAWDRIANAFMGTRLTPEQLDELDSLFSRFSEPPGGQYDGWYQYFERDIRSLLGKRVPRPLENSYCGKGRKGNCQSAIWAAIAAAGQELTSEQGTADPSAWRADADAERIEFLPGILPFTMRYTNRPSGIQQVISFDGG
ncbi:MAG: penicillin acylase family protein [Solirubrobacterales bacterium]